MTYEQFLQVYGHKEAERQTHFQRKRKWSDPPDVSQQNVRVCAVGDLVNITFFTRFNLHECCILQL